MDTLLGKTAVITGASSGIGKAIARRLAGEGSHVFIAGRSSERLQEVARSIETAGGKASIGAFDLHDYDALHAFVAEAASRTGRLDIMVNAAGVHHPGTIADGKTSDWQAMFEANVIAVLAGSRSAIRVMRETASNGHIVTISSYAGEGNAYHVYGATKAAANSVCRALRHELADEPIRVVTIMPGAVATNFGRHYPPEFVNGMFKSFGIAAEFKTGGVLSDAMLEKLHTHASSIFASPDDIASAVLYAVTQPHDLSVSEILVGPRKSFPNAA
ncbi:NADP-dependent 3-hydroxy acid dehydrogenase YdfG [Paraburkholderia sp. BL23I1N1]|uniref:SDR family oxidoreductase n=1 Tax=Paraburkholderia sp. BL23I1N1 TaxID=1938802 RepID=UPI000FF071F2|nr:SDR family oxidoreductase [Paraburkholderia sp. BL23I1N1]RKE39943.1 NADP-dependent 3-hydroxy acid dehydrogenase YdfG [Paraburkholderia sp. BL23I1N1]